MVDMSRITMVYFKFPCPYSGCTHWSAALLFSLFISLSFMHNLNFYLVPQASVPLLTLTFFVFLLLEKIEPWICQTLSISNSTCQHQLPFLRGWMGPLPSTSALHLSSSVLAEFLSIISPWLSHLKSVSPPDLKMSFQVYSTLKKKRQNKKFPLMLYHISNSIVTVSYWFPFVMIYFLSVLWFWILSSVNLNL